MKIAFIGKPGAGKDTCASILVEKYGGDVVKFAAPVYDICEAIQTTLGKPVVKDRQLLRMVGEGLKNVYSSDIWVNHAAPIIDDILASGATNLYISDLRFRNELEMLRERNFIIVRVHREGHNDTYYTESELDRTTVDYNIDNTSMESLVGQLDELVHHIKC